MAITIFTDSGSDLPVAVAQAKGIKVVPITVIMGEKQYRDGIDISAGQFYEKVAKENLKPTTAQPNPAEFAEAFGPALAAGDTVVYVGLSSGLSGSVQSAFMAKELVEAPERLHVIDSLGASMGQGLLALYAADLAAQGTEVEALIQQVEAYRDSLYHVFTLNTLEFAKRSGRVNAVQALAAGLLDIKPILRIDMEGKIVNLDKTRGRKRSLKRVLDEIEAKGVSLKGQRVAVSHAVCLPEAQAMVAEMKERFGVGEVVLGEIGPTIGAHVGPGTMAFFFSGQAGRA